MSAAVIAGAGRPLRLWDATIGKKVVMAITGVILFGYVIGHLAGNLQIFAPVGADGVHPIDRYAGFLHASPALLWGVRLFLLATVFLHILASVQLGWIKMQARPSRYVKFKPQHSSYASRTMLWSGPILAAFIVFHILHLTTGTVHTQFQQGSVYNNMVLGFQQIPVSLFYLLAVGMLMLHLYHGLWSMFQSVGANHPRYTPGLRRMAAAVAIILFIGYASIPLAVMAGIVEPQ